MEAAAVAAVEAEPAAAEAADPEADAEPDVAPDVAPPVDPEAGTELALPSVPDPLPEPDPLPDPDPGPPPIPDPIPPIPEPLPESRRPQAAPAPDTMVLSQHEAGARDLVREEWALTWPGGRFAIERRAIVLGRSRDCDVVLADTNVSRRHAELVRHGGGFVLRDLDSTNGSLVNGRRVREAAVDGRRRPHARHDHPQARAQADVAEWSSRRSSSCGSPSWCSCTSSSGASSA